MKTTRSEPNRTNRTKTERVRPFDWYQNRTNRTALLECGSVFGTQRDK